MISASWLTPACGIDINHNGQSLHAAVMHIGRCYSDITQAGCAKPPHIFRLSRMGLKPGILRQKSAFTIQIFKAGIVKGHLFETEPGMSERIGKKRRRVTVEAV